MLKTGKKDGLNNNRKEFGGGSQRSREDGKVSRERVRSSRKVQKAGVRGRVNDGIQSGIVDNRKKRIYAGKSRVFGDRTNKNSIDGKARVFDDRRNRNSVDGKDRVFGERTNRNYVDGKARVFGDRTNKNYVDGKAKSRSADLTPEVDVSANASLGKIVRRVRKVQIPGLELKSKSKKWQSENADLEMRERNGRSSSVLTKKVWGKRVLREDLKSSEDEPKPRKRVIRIDPHDISNKRLDDGVVVPGVNYTIVKKDTPEKNAPLSKNAQFRAIQPSPSILSFVEDNMLGRRRMIDLKRAGYDTDFSAPLDNTPFSTSPERGRIEENVFRNKLSFYAAAKISSSFPSPELPEIAFAGKSNVGKSSLLNALTRQWGVARTSDKPGLTQTINFFKLGTKLCLVDLPGYGFAYAKEEAKDSWEELVKEYVCTRNGLKRVCLLVDTKGGLNPRDHELIDLMERYQTKYQIILTKTDLMFPIDVARRAMKVEETLKGNKSSVQPLMMVSSKSGAGVSVLRTSLARIARFVKI